MKFSTFGLTFHQRPRKGHPGFLINLHRCGEEGEEGRMKCKGVCSRISKHGVKIFIIVRIM